MPSFTLIRPTLAPFTVFSWYVNVVGGIRCLPAAIVDNTGMPTNRNQNKRWTACAIQTKP
jgi:hypothetical protein